MKTATQIIDELGGTAAVARLCGIKLPSVSGWKKANHIPSARAQLFRVLRPDVFRTKRS